MTQAKLKLSKVFLFLAAVIVSGVIGWTLGAYFPFYFQKQNSQKVGGLYPVAEVVDGDTIWVNFNGEKKLVRLLGINTPEINDKYRKGECFGPEAKQEMEKLLSGKKVYLLPDPKAPDKGKYNRLLRYVFLPNGEFVNADLVRDGYAFEYTYQPFQFMEYFHSLESQAKQERKGLWSDKCNYYFLIQK